MELFLQRESRERDDGHGLGTSFSLPLPHPLRRVVTIHDRHLQIHQHEVVRLAPELLHRDCTVLGDVELMRRGVEIIANERPAVFRVFDEKDPERRVFALRSSLLHGGSRGGGDFERHAEGEGAPLPSAPRAACKW